MILDARTIGIFSVMTPFALGLIMLIYLRERKVYGGFGHWILANFGLSMGYIFISLRGIIPSFLSDFISNLLIVCSLILIYDGIEQFYGRPAFSKFNYLVLSSYFLLLSYFTFFDPNDSALVALSSLVSCLLILHAGMRFFHVSIPELERTSRVAGLVFFITALFPWMRAVSSLFASGPIAYFSHVLASWFALVFIVSIVMWTFHFFFLTSARLELDLEIARAQVDVISRTDPLTNLYNRRHFDEQAEIEFQRAKRSGHAISFLLLDLDDFKSVNDTYGHDTGDFVLLLLAEILRDELRPFDLIARYGGDEFVVMLMDTNEEQAQAIAERIRKRVMETPFESDAGTFDVTLSIGITPVHMDDRDLRLILKRSDTALYEAKQHGRNCVIVS